MERIKKHYRHGDVILKSIKTIPTQAKRVEGETVLAEGEVTGHAHRMDAAQAARFVLNERAYLKILTEEPAALTHEEHSRAEISALNYEKTPCYEIVIQRDYDPEGDVKVTD